MSTPKLNSMILGSLEITGGYKRALNNMKESLNRNEYNDIREFFAWLQLKKQTVGPGNIVSQWSAFFADKAKGKNADMEYQKVLKEVRELLTAITTKVNLHAQSQSYDRHNWGYVGDLSSVKESLLEIAETAANYGN